MEALTDAPFLDNCQRYLNQVVADTRSGNTLIELVDDPHFKERTDKEYWACRGVEFSRQGYALVNTDDYMTGRPYPTEQVDRSIAHAYLEDTSYHKPVYAPVFHGLQQLTAGIPEMPSCHISITALAAELVVQLDDTLRFFIEKPQEAYYQHILPRFGEVSPDITEEEIRRDKEEMVARLVRRGSREGVLYTHETNPGIWDYAGFDRHNKLVPGIPHPRVDPSVLSTVKTPAIWDPWSPTWEVQAEFEKRVAAGAEFETQVQQVLDAFACDKDIYGDHLRPKISKHFGRFPEGWNQARLDSARDFAGQYPDIFHPNPRLLEEQYQPLQEPDPDWWYTARLTVPQ